MKKQEQQSWSVWANEKTKAVLETYKNNPKKTITIGGVVISLAAYGTMLAAHTYENGKFDCGAFNGFFAVISTSVFSTDNMTKAAFKTAETVFYPLLGGQLIAWAPYSLYKGHRAASDCCNQKFGSGSDEQNEKTSLLSENAQHESDTEKVVNEIANDIENTENTEKKVSFNV